MTKIKLNNVEVDKAELVKLYKEKPELFKEKEKPLGDDFSMLGYLKLLRYCLNCYSINLPQNIQTVDISKRLNALIKIWEWKEENDGEFGVAKVMRSKFKEYVVLDDARTLVVSCCTTWIPNSELPYFSPEKGITERALEELEQEYKIVFNVK